MSLTSALPRRIRFSWTSDAFLELGIPAVDPEGALGMGWTVDPAEVAVVHHSVVAAAPRLGGPVSLDYPATLVRMRSLVGRDGEVFSKLGSLSHSPSSSINGRSRQISPILLMMEFSFNIGINLVISGS